MKVLVLGKRKSILRWYEHVLAAEVPGATLAGFALNYHNEFEHLANHINRAFRGQGLWQTVGKRLNRFLEGYRPDICIIADRFYLQGGVDEALAATGVPVCQWVGDRFEPRLFDNRSVSHFFFTDSGLQAAAEGLGCTRGDYLPLAVNPAQFGAGRPWSARVPEPLFIGAWSENREALLAGVRTPLAIYGKGWDRLRGTPHRIHAANISLARVARLYGEHRLVLNVINSSNIVSGLNMRCFEAPAAGACLVTDSVVDLPRCYLAGEEVVTYSGAAMLDERLAQLATDDALAAGIADRGKARCLREHTYSHRVRTMIERVTR